MNPLSSTARAAALLLFALSAMAAVPQAPPKAQAAHAPAPRLTIVGLPNFAEVSPRLYRGGQPTLPGFEKLKKMGIDIVVDLRLSRKEEEREIVNKEGMQFVALPWHCTLPRDEIFARFLLLLRENPKKKIFVHCRYGDDRTGMMVAAYRMAFEGWTRQEARQEMNKFGFHHYLCAPLVRYENKFSERLKTGTAFEEWRSDGRGDAE